MGLGGYRAAPVELTILEALRDAIVFVDNALIEQVSGLCQNCCVRKNRVMIVRACAIERLVIWLVLSCFQLMYSSKRLCIRALPHGVATMDPKRYRVIDIEDRAERVYNFQKKYKVRASKNY